MANRTLLSFTERGIPARECLVVTATSRAAGSPKSMRQATIAIFVIAITSILAVASSTAADARRHRPSVRCGTGRGRVIAADARAQLYISLNIEESLIVHGCVYGHRHSYELGYVANESACSSTACLDIRGETLTGTIVAYEYFSFVGEDETFLVVVRDLRNGRVIHEMPTGTPIPPDPHAVGDGSTSIIVVKSNGSVAWITKKPLKGETTEYQVHAVDRTGDRLLAIGTDIGPKSLALVGSTLYWAQGGQPHSTVLD